MSEAEEVAPELEAAILQQVAWEAMAPALRKLAGSSRDVWERVVLRYSLRRQLRWRSSLVRSLVPDERAFYIEMQRQCRTRLTVTLERFRSSFCVLFDIFQKRFGVKRSERWCRRRSFIRTICRTFLQRHFACRPSSTTTRCWKISCYKAHILLRRT